MRDYIPERVILCEVCGKGGGTLVKVGEGYRHKQCKGEPLYKGRGIRRDAGLRIFMPSAREVREYTEYTRSV